MVAYNAGRGQTHEWMQENGWDYKFNDIKSIPYPDTREYVAKVMQDRDKMCIRDRYLVGEFKKMLLADKRGMN